MKPNVPLFHKPAWDRTKDPTIDPTLLDPNTGMPVNGQSVEQLSKKHLFTAAEWQKVLVAAGLADAPVAGAPAVGPAVADVRKVSEAEGEEVPEAPVISVPVGVTTADVEAHRKAMIAARVAKAAATRAANKAKGKTKPRRAQ